MSLDFSALRKNSSLANTDLVKKAQESSNKTYDDDRFWSCQQDKSGNGYAVIRFLPAPKGEELPWVKYFRHAFKGPTGKWYIENSLTSIDQPDPLAEANSLLWSSGFDADKEIARKRNRKMTFVSNIYVIKDPANPENEGKAFLWRYGKTIFDMIKDAMNPPKEFEDETPINPFDFWKGANFKLKIVKKDDYPNYDKSEFESVSPLSNDDSFLEQLWDKEYSLQEFLDPKNFKTYDELKKRLAFVLDEKPKKDESTTHEEQEEESPVAKKKHEDKQPPARKEKVEEKVEEKEEPIKETPKYGDSDEEDDDIPNYFAGLGK